MEQKGLHEEESHLLASLSEGSPGKGLEIQEEILQIPRGDLLKGWMGLKKPSFEEMENWIESLPTQRENLLLILEVSKTLLRDLIMIKALKEGAKLIHSDLVKEMESIAPQWSLSTLMNRMKLLHQTALAIKGNANTTLALEGMMLSWAEG
jgi:DNA polymerase III gamma/tau subunit